MVNPSGLAYYWLTRRTLEGVPCNPPPPCHVAFPIWCLPMADGVTTWWAKKEAEKDAKEAKKEAKKAAMEKGGAAS